MGDPEKKVQEFTCPVCHVKVIYDPDDSQIIVTGANRRKIGIEPSYVYLLCSNEHRRRYNLKPANS